MSKRKRNASNETKLAQVGRRRRISLILLVCLTPVVLYLAVRGLAGLPNRMARAELASHRPLAARGWLSWSTWWRPDDPQAAFLLARACRKQGQASEFREHLDRARTLGFDPQRCNLEEILAEAQAGQLYKAERRMDTLFDELGEDAPEASEALAGGYLLTFQFDRARDILKAWQADFPRHARPHYMLGLLWQNLGSSEQAEEAFRQALSLQADHADAALALAGLLVEQKRLDEALANFELCLKSMSHASAARLGKARCLRLKGQLEPARKLLEEALAATPGDANAAIEMGRLEMESGEYQKALSWLEAAVEKSPRDVELRYLLATALSGSDRKTEAQAHYEFVDKGREAKNRIKDLVFRVSNQPQDSQTRAEVGRLFLDYGTDDEALIWLRSALVFDSACHEAHAGLADYYQRKKIDDPRYARLEALHRELALSATNKTSATQERNTP